MNLAILKTASKTIASTTLGIASELLDKGAELATEAKDYLDTVDTSGRDARKAKRTTSIFGYDKDKS